MAAKIPQGLISSEIWVYKATPSGVDLFLVNILGRGWATSRLYHISESGEWKRGDQSDLTKECLTHQKPILKITLPEPDPTPYTGESDDHILQLVHEDLVEMFMENPDELRRVYEDKET